MAGAMVVALGPHGVNVTIPEDQDPMAQPTEIEILQRRADEAWSEFDMRRQIRKLAKARGDEDAYTAALIEEQLAYLAWDDIDRELDAARAKEEGR